MCLNLYFMRLNLFAVNSKGTDAQSRIVFLWASLLWVTSIHGISMITKRNHVCACLPLVFLAMGDDVGNLRHVTSEPSEHTFGLLRYEKREFTVSEMCDLVRKLASKMKALFESKLKHSRDPKKGYQATMNNFIEHTKDTGTEGCGPFEVTDASLNDGLAPSIWNAGGLPQLLSNVSKKMKTLLTMLGVSNDDISPFLRDCSGFIKEEMIDPFTKYMPETSNNDPEDDDNPTTVIVHEILHQRIIGELLATFEERGNSPESKVDRKHENAGESDGGSNRNKSGGSSESGARSESNASSDEDTEGSNLVSRSAMAAFKSVLELAEQKDWENMAPEVVRRAMSTMDLKKRDKGSTSIGQKAKSLISRWFTKMEVKDLIRTQMPKGPNTTAILGTVAPLIERNVIVRVKRRGDCCVFELYAVLAVFNKHYNKWFMLGPNDTFPMFQRANSRKQTPTKSSSDDGNAASTTITSITKNPSTKGKRKRKKDPEPTAATQEKKKKESRTFLSPSYSHAVL